MAGYKIPLPGAIKTYRTDYDDILNATNEPIIYGRRASYQDPEAEVGKSPVKPKRDISSYKQALDELSGSGEALEKFYQHAQNIPQAEEYAPGKWGRVLAGLQGFATGLQGGAARGYAAAQNVIQSPYRNALEEWQIQGTGLKAAADIEQQRDAKRSAYLKELREFDKDEYTRLIEENKAESARITANARREQAEAQTKLAELTARRDQEHNSIERGKLDNEITKTKQALEIANKNIAAEDRRTGALVKIGAGHDAATVTSATIRGKAGGGGSTTEHHIPASEQDLANIQAHENVMRNPKFADVAPFVTIDKGVIKIDPSGGYLGRSLKNADVRLKAFQEAVEAEKSRIINLKIKLTKESDSDITDLDALLRNK